ncbi:MAG: T9SS type A sorting domain-containing protein [Bacteroidota bacterium]
MRILYTAFLLLISAPFIFSQKLEFGPIQGNAVLRSHVAQQELKTNAYLKRHFGSLPNEGSNRDGLDDCPPDLPVNLIVVESGGTILIDVDTFGLAVDTTPPTIELITDPPLVYGMANYIDSTNVLSYEADPDLNGIAADTVLLQYEQGGGEGDTIIKIAIDIRRAPKTIVANTIVLDPGEVVEYCLTDDLDFPLPISCFTIVDCFVPYDGNDYHFDYLINDSCIVYGASRFPGTDTVCLQLCDEIGICDMFKIPFQIRTETIILDLGEVFFDDFSNTIGPFPSPRKWLEDDVFINNTFARNPPSVGMATFDGLSRGGQPYELPAGGVGDRLTSVPIDLTGLNPGSSVYLKFFLAPKGFGQEPEIDDEFYVEFRNNQGEWIEMLEIDGPTGLILSDVPPFKFYAIKVDQSQFFHDAFQIRFSAETSPGGYGDWWHLDYIELKAGTTVDSNFVDFAFSTVPETFLRNYTSIPLRHLQEQIEAEIKDSIDFELDRYQVSVSNRNFLNDYSFAESFVRFTRKETGNQFNENFNVASANESKTTPLAHNEISVVIPKDNRGQLIDSLEQLTGLNPIQIETSFEFVGNDDDEEVQFRPNDTVSLTTTFSNYFAHDDGSAEIQFFWRGPVGGEQAAIQYKTNVEDTLKGVRVMFPHFSFIDFTDQFFKLMVWQGDANGPDRNADPIYESEVLKPFYPDAIRDTLQGFTTYKLEDFSGPTPVVMAPDTYFYVGFEQLVTTDPVGIPVGFDLNNPCDCNYWRLNSDTTWVQYDPLVPEGAMMIRPVFADVINTTNSVGEIADEKSVINLFPNPANSFLHVEIEQSVDREIDYHVFNQLGQLIDQGRLQRSIDVGNLSPGNYYLQLMDKFSGEVWIEKFVVSR